MRWQANALPTDDLCSENAIMLKRFNRYPLIIDPSGQATDFIMNEYRDKKISKTSFLDDSFRKNLESALRFGNPLLVQVKVYLYQSESNFLCCECPKVMCLYLVVHFEAKSHRVDC